MDFLAEYKITFVLIGVVYFIVLFIADLYDYLQDFRRIINIGKVLSVCWIGTLAVYCSFTSPSKAPMWAAA